MIWGGLHTWRIFPAHLGGQPTDLRVGLAPTVFDARESSFGWNGERGKKNKTTTSVPWDTAERSTI